MALKKTSRINSIFFYYIAGGSISVLSVLQSFVEESVSSWCFFTSGETLYGILLRMPPATFSTVYQWKGVFVPVEVNICLQTTSMLLNKEFKSQFYFLFLPQNFSMWNPKSCVSFQIHASPYLVITHGGARQGASNNSVYAFVPGHRLLKVNLFYSQNHKIMGLERTSGGPPVQPCFRKKHSVLS